MDLRIRAARAADLRHLAAVEDSGLALYEQWWGDLEGDVLAGPAVAGAERVAHPGFLLVAGQPPVGFAHVLEIDGHAHLEQLSVDASVLRRGLGSALVRAAMSEARAQGYDEISLCTYRDVPWNGPFYQALGFVEVEQLRPYQRRLREHEQEIGLDRHGPRVVMAAPLRRDVTGE